MTGAAFGQQPDGRQVLVDAIAAANWQLRLDLFHEQLRAGQADPAEVAKTEKLTADTIARLRGKWSGTVHRYTFDNAFNRALKDPRYRAQAVNDYDREHSGGGWSFPELPALMPGIRSVITVVSYVIVGAVGIFLFLFVVKLGFKKSEAPAVQPQAPVSDTYGAAEFEQPRTNIPYPSYIFQGVFFGKSSAPGPMHMAPLPMHPGAPIISREKSHVLLVAQTRTGKFSRVIGATLLRYFSGSIFAVDMKGELAAVSARARRNAGNKVHIVNPWGALGTTFADLGFAPASYNPLDVLDRNDPNVVATAQSLAGAICPTEKHEKDAFWSRSAANMLTAVLLWLTDREGLPDSTGVIEVKTLARAREIVTLGRKDFESNFLKAMALSDAFSGAIRENAAPFVGLADATYSGIMQHLAEKTGFLSDPRTKAVTSSSTFSMNDLMAQDTSVYLVIPPTQMQAQSTWLRLMVTSATAAFKQHGRTRKNRCLFLLDELISLGVIRELPGDVSLMAGLGVDYVLVVQSISAIRDLYGDAAGTIIGNCAYKWFCNVDDLPTAEYLSKVLGSKTVQTKSSSRSYGMSSGNMSSNESTSTGETGRPLLMPDEILHLGRDTAILLAPGDRPHYLRTVDYWDIPEAFAHLKESYPVLYWQPPLAWDKNPLETNGR